MLKPRRSLHTLHPLLPRILLLLATLLATSACDRSKQGLEQMETVDHVTLSISQVVEVAFGPDGRLWRLVPGTEYMQVDVSGNRGASFSPAVRVNQTAQTIQARRDDRPGIQVDRQGRITVLYFAEGPKPWTSYLSYSETDGKSFSAPQLISSDAVHSLHYLDVMRTRKDGTSFIFWLDQRRGNANPAWSTALFHTWFTDPGSMAFPNDWISDDMSPCGRVAVDFARDGQPVVFGRMRFADGSLDHGLLKRSYSGEWQQLRVTRDNWKPDYCPPLNPDMLVDRHDRYHFAWAARYDRKGRHVYYAHSDDRGKTLRRKVEIGNPAALPTAPSLISDGQRLILAWMEQTGDSSTVWIRESADNGDSWQPAVRLLQTRGEADIPRLLRYRSQIYLSWNSGYSGHRVVEIRGSGNSN